MDNIKHKNNKRKALIAVIAAVAFAAAAALGIGAGNRGVSQAADQTYVGSVWEYSEGTDKLTVTSSDGSKALATALVVTDTDSARTSQASGTSETSEKISAYDSLDKAVASADAITPASAQSVTVVLLQNTSVSATIRITRGITLTSADLSGLSIAGIKGTYSDAPVISNRVTSGPMFQVQSGTSGQVTVTGKLHLSGLTSDNETAGTAGPLVRVDAGSTLNISGDAYLENQQNSTRTGGGAVYISGTLEQNGGTIRGCSSAGNGGAVYVAGGGQYSFKNGTLTDNKATGNGGGVYVDRSAAFTMSGGRVTGNSAQSGAGIYVASGANATVGSTDAGKTADITGNRSQSSQTSAGAGIYAGGSVTFTGRTQVNTNTKQAASGSQGSLAARGTKSDLYLERPSNYPITLDGSFDAESNIGILLPDSGTSAGTGNFASVTGDSSRVRGLTGAFFSDAGNYGIGSDNRSLYLGYTVTYEKGDTASEKAEWDAKIDTAVFTRNEAADTYTRVVTADNFGSVFPAVKRDGYYYDSGNNEWSIKPADAGENDSWEAVTDTTARNLARYTADGTITVRPAWHVLVAQLQDSKGRILGQYDSFNDALRAAAEKNTVVLCRDTAVEASSAVSVSGITIESKTGSDKKTIHRSRAVNILDVRQDCDVTLRNITLSGADADGTKYGASIVSVRGTLNLEEGVTIRDMDYTSGTTRPGNTSGYGAVYVQSGGVLDIKKPSGSGSEPEITGNATQGAGGGIWLGSRSKCTMNSGKITGNSAQSAQRLIGTGAGVYVSNGAEFTMNGGSVTGNSVQGSNGAGAGVYVDKGAAFTMKAGSISGNICPSGKGALYAGGNVTLDLKNNPTVTGNRTDEETDSDSSNIYVADGSNLSVTDIPDAAPEGMYGAGFGITMENPDDGYFTSSLDKLPENFSTADIYPSGSEGYGIRDIFSSDTEDYGVGIGKDTAGATRAYLGYVLTLNPVGGTVKDKNSETSASVKKTVLPGRPAGTLPVAYREARGFINWNTSSDPDDEGQVYDENTIVRESTELFAVYGDANVQNTNTNKDYYSLNLAVKDASQGDTLSVTADTLTVSETVRIDKPVTIKVDQNTNVISSSADLKGPMFRIVSGDGAGKGTDQTVTFDGVILDGTAGSNSLISLESGSLRLTGGNQPSVLRNTARSQNDVPDSGTATGALYVKAGTAVLDNVSIRDNKSSAPGAGIHMDGGTVKLGKTLSGSSSGTEVQITGNVSDGQGGGIYVGKNAELVINSGSVKGNTSGAAAAGGESGTGTAAASQGSQIYCEGEIAFGEGDKGNAGGNPVSGVSPEIAGTTSAPENAIYLADGAYFSFAGRLNSDLHFTMQNPDQGAFTKGLAGNSKSPMAAVTQFITGNEGYSVGIDDDGEAFLGYRVTFRLSSRDESSPDKDYFTDEENLPEDRRSRSRDTVVPAGKTVSSLPEVSCNTRGLRGWFDQDNNEITESTVIDKAVTCTASWADSVARIEKNVPGASGDAKKVTYYARFDRAVKAAEADRDATVIILMADVSDVDSTLAVTTDITVSGDGTAYSVGRVADVPLFRIEQGGKLTAENVELNGNDHSTSLIYVNGGEFDMKPGTEITGSNNTNGTQTDAPARGFGTVYVRTGTFRMSGGEISGNSAVRGAGVYLEAAGKAYLSGGTITGNRITRVSDPYGAGVYVGSGRGNLQLSGDIDITGNKNASGAEQNVYITAGEGYVSLDTTPITGSVGVTLSRNPTGYDNSAMLDVTGRLDNAVSGNYRYQSLFSDDPVYETILDKNNARVRLRNGHTVSFDASPGDVKATLNGTSEITRKHGEAIGTLPGAALKGRYFEGWYSEKDGAGERITEDYTVNRSMTAYAKYTAGLLDAPVLVSGDPGGVSADAVYNLTGDNATVSFYLTASSDASIYYTTDGSDPDPSAANELYDGGPITVSDDLHIKAVAVMDDWTSSSIMDRTITVNNVIGINISSKPEAFYRGYTSPALKADVRIGNRTTSKDVTWRLEGSYASGTFANADGTVTVDEDETAMEITLTAVSVDPGKADSVTLPVRNQYTVTYNNNPPAGRTVRGTLTDEKSPYAAGSQVTVLGILDSTGRSIISLQDYTFTGWNTRADGAGDSYQPGDRITPEGNVVLYAQWMETINITGVSVRPASITLNELYPDVKDTSILTDDNSFTGTFTATVRGTYPKDKGRVKWSISGNTSPDTTIDPDTGRITIGRGETGSTAAADLNSSGYGTFRVIASSVDDPAKYGQATVAVKPLNRYSIIYRGNGGKGAVTDSSSPYIEGSTATVLDNSFTRPGYRFQCWGTDQRSFENKTGDTYKPGDTITMNSAVAGSDKMVILYAQWVEDSSAGTTQAPDTATAATTEHVKTDEEILDDVIAKINAIGDNVTLDSKPAIDAARAAVNSLTEEQRNKLGDQGTFIEKLEIREKMYNALLRENASPTAASSAESTVPASASEAAGSTSAARSAVRQFTKGDLVYRITKYGDAPEVTAYRARNKKDKRITIPATTTYRNVKYKVTSVADNAFKGDKKLYKVTVGKNVTKIGKKAFYRTPALYKIKIKSRKLSAIGSKAFAKTKKRCYIRVPDDMYRRYEPMIRASRPGKTVRLQTY